MSKNIAIQEGGTAKSMTVHKLKTTLVAGGTCLWVPEDEVSLGTKHITENGTYTALEDGKYGYSQVTVNVPGGAGSASSSGTPTTSGGTTPGGIGSAVVGTDPTDGNEYGVGVDENGNLVSTKVPSNIAVSKEPDKVDYTVGETIDYSGIIVTLKGGDGEPFSNSDYPNGRIPFSELEFPITTASNQGIEADTYEWGGAKLYSANKGSSALKTTPGYPDDGYASGEGNAPIYGFYYYTYQNDYNSVTTILVSNERFGYTLPQPGSIGGIKGSAGRIVDGKWLASIEGQTTYIDAPVVFSVPIQSYAVGEAFLNQYRGSGSFSPHAATMSVPVQWTSPYDGRTFEDTFEITVTTSSGESSGEGEGGGGGHSF